jgi:antitoxin component YwqK of YwqJK toxin-antitoxin module
MKFFFFTFSLVLIFNQSFSQSSFASQIPLAEKYDPKKVVDDVYGIRMYDKLIAVFENDTVRKNKKGYKEEGEIEDYYLNDKPIHKGLYVEGKLRAFKNFYPNSTIERSYKMIDLKKSEMIEYYPNGNLKSEIKYFESYAVKQIDYYENGKISYDEESSKNGDYLVKRNSYKEDGKPSITFELVDKKKKLYLHKEFYENGTIKEEGSMAYFAELGDFVKEGSWSSFSINGEITKKQNFHEGNVVE